MGPMSPPMDVTILEATFDIQAGQLAVCLQVPSVIYPPSNGRKPKARFVRLVPV